MNDSDVGRTVEFFEKWCPNPGSKNFHTQLGVHLEEITEMLETIKSSNKKYSTQFLINMACDACHNLSQHLKKNDDVIEIADNISFLDGLADQIVTAAGIAHMAGMDIAGAFGEVNRSNFSKFGENGEPILDANLKMVKGPHYTKPNLTPYLKK